jgi:hypothetical protein
MIFMWILLSCTPIKALDDIDDSSGFPSTDTPDTGSTLDDSVEEDTAAEPPPEDSGTPPIEAEVTIDGAPVWDRYLSGPLTLLLNTAGDGTLDVWIANEDNDIIVRLNPTKGGETTIDWDGTTTTGTLAKTGGYTVHATLTDGDTEAIEASTEHALDIVRVGVQAGKFVGPTVDLLWHRMGGPGSYFAAGSDAPNFWLDDIDGDATAQVFPDVWENLDSPPDDTEDHNTAAAYRFDAVPELRLTWEGSAQDRIINVTLDGWSSTDDTFEAGGQTYFLADAQVADGPRVVEPTLSLAYSSDGVVFARQEIPTRLYAVLDSPAWGAADLRYQPWLAAIDPALRAIDGVAPTAHDVTNALVEFIYRELGLEYDTDWGASSYVSYTGRDYSGAHFDMSSFLNRSRGSVINCTDAAAILQAYANMLGVDLSYAIVTPGFNLNYIKAIGGDTFTHCPFGGGGCGFSYHAVTTTDDAATIYDATLALDGDEDPSQSPSTEMLVQGIDGDAYRSRLVMSGSPNYRYIQKGTIQ